MFKRLRQAKLSLATKCQLLFGAAVALIITAALFVPWQRMDQLTEEINEKAAAAVAEMAIAQHEVEMARREFAFDLSAIRSAATLPATTQSLRIDGGEFFSPRLIGIEATKQPERLTRFELSSLNRFLKDSRKTSEHRYYDTKGIVGYRYAAALRGGESCSRCHDASPDTPKTSTAPTSAESVGTAVVRTNPEIASTLPTTQPAALMGIVSVDIPSQVRAPEVLLNRVFLLSAGLLAGVLAIVTFYLIITRLILQPVAVLQETAEKVSEGDLNIRSDINSGDEFQQLSETFNTMLVNLKRSADQLRAVNKSLDLKLGQLAESNVALYESNRLKSEFLANVSHELRTPLNSILGFAQLLKDQVQPAAESKPLRFIQNIVSSGNALLDLINDLLDLAKIEAGRMEVRSERLSLPDLLEGLASLLKPLGESRKVTITVSVAPDVPIIQTDPGKLQQILYNFISNAIKFSPADSKIDLAARLIGPQRVKLSVSDSGPGIEPDKQQVIFEKFRQIDGSHTRQHGGTGLGLAIAKELAQLLEGSVGVESTLGAGATFWIVIPLAIESGSQDVRAKMVLN